MRILIVCQYFWPEGFRVNDLAAELVRRGHAVTVLTGKPNYPSGRLFPDFAADPGRFKQYEGVDVVRVPIVMRGTGGLRLVLNYASYALMASTLGLWRLRRHAFDVVLVYQLSPVSMALPGILVRWRRKVPLAMWVFDLWPETLRAIGVVRSERVMRLAARLVDWIYARCDLIMAQSRSFVGEIRARCADGKAIDYVPNWAEAIFQPGDSTEAGAGLGREGEFAVLFAGNMGEAQDFPAILAAVEALRDYPRVHWYIAGDGRAAAWVREQIGRRGLAAHITLLGRRPVEEMPALYRSAQVLLVSLKDAPIFSMTIPGKLQSYLAAGVPVVAMLNGEGADVVRRSNAGYTVPCGDATGLAASIRRLAELSPEALAEMGRNARRFSETEFDRMTLVSRVEQALGELTRSRRC